MLTAHIQSAMRNATYEVLDEQTFCGEIVGFQGVYANAEKNCNPYLKAGLSSD